ncbi:MAG: DEAD/DEAH box helicase [Deltaproteobacteria bacterium]|nr:MAG: DEAD/DEAH box helicase [Deltaproteobacteria bacterium]
MSFATAAATTSPSPHRCVELRTIRATRMDPDGRFVQVPIAVARIAGSDDDDVRLCLERLGAVEIAWTDLALPPGIAADYVLDLDDDPHAVGDVAARLGPALADLGVRLELARDFPYRIVQDAAVRAEISTDDDEGDWFELHLGIEVDGRYVDLLPAVVDLVSSGRLALPRGRKHVSLPLGPEGYVTLPRERIARLVDVIRELYEIDGFGPGGGVRIPACHPGYVEAIEDALGVRTESSGRRRRPRGTHEGQASVPPAPPEGTVRATLRPYQRAGVAWLADLHARGVGGVLADDMGLGKTLQTITHLARTRAARVGPPDLVVAPTSLLGNWRREIARFAPQLRVVTLHGRGRASRLEDARFADVVITTYALLVRDLEIHAARPYGIVVVDEAQTVKNARCQAHAALRTLDAEQIVCLSGTPIENDLEELRALFELAVPGLLGSRLSFREKFADPIERCGDTRRLEALRRRVAPFVLRRLKSEVATELPPKTEIVRHVDLGSAQRDLYESIRIAAHGAVRKAIRKKGLAGARLDILSALTKLRQVCCDPRLVPVGAAAHVAESAKLTALLEMIEDLRAAGRRALVFSQFTSMLALVSEAFEARGIEHLVLTGSSRDRQGLVDRFERGEGDVFLISLKAGGAGLNLTSADTVIHYDPWWNPAAQRQATDRVYRIGQTRPVHVYELIVSGSVEARMVALKRRKQALADALFGEGNGGGFSEEDVEHLLAPLADDP